MPDINHPVRHALRVLGVGPDPAIRSLYYRWAGFMADVRWGRRPPSPDDQTASANRMRRDLLAHFNDDRVLMKRQMEVLRSFVFSAIDHAKVLGAQKRAEEHQLTLKKLQDDERPYPPEHLARAMSDLPAFATGEGVYLTPDQRIARYMK